MYLKEYTMLKYAGVKFSGICCRGLWELELPDVSPISTMGFFSVKYDDDEDLDEMGETSGSSSSHRPRQQIPENFTPASSAGCLKEDMENYMRHKMMGGYMRLKKNVIPRFFECQKTKGKPAKVIRKKVILEDSKLPQESDDPLSTFEVFAEPLKMKYKKRPTSNVKKQVWKVASGKSILRPIQKTEMHHKREYSETEDASTFDHKQYFKQICRLCMGRLSDNEFEVITEKKSDYVNKILLCCSITSTEDSNLPQCICSKCIDSLEQAYTFRLKCLKINKKILKIFHNSIYGQSVQMPDDSRLLDESEIKTEIKDVVKVEFEAQEQNHIQEIERFLNIDSIIKKEELIIENDGYFDDNFYDCDIKQDGGENVVNENLQIESTDYDKDENSEKNKFFCKKCPYICFTKADCHLHKRSHCVSQPHSPIPSDCNVKLLNCQVEDCKLQFTSFPDRRAHVLEFHMEESFNGCFDICPYCAYTVPLSYTSTHAKNLDKHIRFTHTNELMFCNECSYETKNRRLMVKHIENKHDVAKRLACPHCGKLIINRHFRGHVRKVHSKTRKLPNCPFCGKKFFDNHNLRTHMRSHTGELPFKCPECGQAFGHNVSMKSHRLKVHQIDMFKKK